MGQADSTQEALRLVETLSPDVVVLDIRLRTGSGIEVARALRRQGAQARVLVLTAYDDEQYVTALTRAGLSGYITKDVAGADLIKAIHEVHEGEGVLPGTVAATVLHSLSRSGKDFFRPAEALSAREIEVRELIAQHYRNEAIAQRLNVSVRTVETHVAIILGKLGAKSRAEAVQRGLLMSD